MLTDEGFFTFLSPVDLIRRIFSIYWSRLLLFTQLAVIVVIPQIILSVTMRKPPLMDDSEMVYEEVQEASQGMTPQEFVIVGLEITLSYLITIFIQAAIIHVVSEIYMQKHSTFKRSLAVACDRFCAIFGFGLLYSAVFMVFAVVVGIPVALLLSNDGFFLGVFIGVVALAFAFYIMISLMLVLPILVVENQSAIGAVKRSFELVPGYRCYIFCSVFLVNFVVLLSVSALYQRLVVKVFGATILATIISGLSALITVPLQTIMVAVLYFSVRTQKEGMNTETLMKEFEVDMDGTEKYAHRISGGETV